MQSVTCKLSATKARPKLMFSVPPITLHSYAKDFYFESRFDADAWGRISDEEPLQYI